MNIMKSIDHNRYQAIGGLLAVAALVFGLGCQPNSISPISQRQVSSQELGAEVEAFNAEQEAKKVVVADTYDSAVASAQAEFETSIREAKASAKAGLGALQLEVDVLTPKVSASYDELELEAERYGILLGLGEQLAEVHLAPWLAIAGLTGLIGIGADNRRKNSVIKRQKVGDSI